MMRSSVVVAALSLITLGAMTALGLNVPTEEMVSADAPSPDATSFAQDAAGAGAVPVGPQLIASIGPASPAVPALTLRSTSPPPAPVPAGPLPERLRVPAIDIDAPIVGTGVDLLGRFDVPDPLQVGWYEHGPLPGNEGAAVLAAHVDLGHVAGVFFHLDDVLLGDRIYIDFADGSSQTFEVVSEVLYDKSALPESELFRDTGEVALHLVTCGGVYDAVAHHYLGNRVVTARLVD